MPLVEQLHESTHGIIRSPLVIPGQHDGLIGNRQVVSFRMIGYQPFRPSHGPVTFLAHVQGKPFRPETVTQKLFQQGDCMRISLLFSHESESNRNRHTLPHNIDLTGRRLHLKILSHNSHLRQQQANEENQHLFHVEIFYKITII